MSEHPAQHVIVQNQSEYRYPEYTVRALVKQTSKGFRVDEISVTVRYEEHPNLHEPLTMLKTEVSDHIAAAHEGAQFECDRLNREAGNATP
jgi:hypothetical protein